LQFSGSFNGRKSPRLEGLVLWSDGVFLEWRLDGDKVGLAGIARLHLEYQGKSLRSFFATSRIRRALRRRPRPGFMADGIPRIPAVSWKVLSGTPQFAFHFARPLSIGSSALAVRRGSPAPVTGMRGACRQSAVPMNITQIICQVLPGRNLAAKAASVLKRHVFTESGGNS
jgi:hypothetical protein